MEKRSNEIKAETPVASIQLTTGGRSGAAVARSAATGTELEKQINFSSDSFCLF